MTRDDWNWVHSRQSIRRMLEYRIGQKRLELEEICKNFGLSSAGIIGTFKLVLQLEEAAKSVHYVT